MQLNQQIKNRIFSKPFFVNFPFLLVLSLLSVLPLNAQSGQGSLGGLVVDSQGSAVPDANLSVKSQETGTVVTTRSNGEGTFSIRPLNPGTYTLTVERTGGLRSSKGSLLTLSRTSRYHLH
jgi:hypothetical protein